VTLNSFQLTNLGPSDSRSIWRLEIEFEEGGKTRRPGEKDPWSKVENQQ